MVQSSPILTEYPSLVKYFNQFSSGPHSLALLFCQALNQETLEQSVQKIAILIGTLSKEFDDQKLYEIEDFCEENKCNFGQILLLLGERSLIQDCAEDLYIALKALILKTSNSTYHFITAWLALNLNDLEDCIEICKNTPLKNADVYGLMGQAAIESQQFNLAHECFEQSTALAPKDSLQWFWLAKTTCALGQIEESWAAAMECFKLEPRNFQCIILLSIVARSEPLVKTRLQTAWKIIFDLIPASRSNSLLSSLLVEIAMIAGEKDKLLASLDLFEIYGEGNEKKELIEKLPQMLRELDHKWSADQKPHVLEKLTQIISPD